MKMAGMMILLLLVSGCASLMGEAPEDIQAKQRAAQMEQLKHDQLQMEAERLRSEVKLHKEELDSL